MKLRIFLVVSAFLAPSSLANAQSGAGGSPLKNFNAMQFPRDQVEVGAKWLALGPNGDGTSADNLVTTSGLSEAQLSNSLRSKLATSFSNWLGLNVSHDKTFKVRYGKLSSVRVRNISKVQNLSSGQAILYEAIKAGEIYFTADSATALAIKAKAEGEGLEAPITTLQAAGSAETTSLVTVRGKDLFVAFRVVRLGTARTKTIRKPFPGNLSEYLRIGYYDVTISDPNGCNTAPPKAVTVSAMNMSVPDIYGNYPVTTFKFLPGEMPMTFPLAVLERVKNIVTGNMRLSYNPVPVRGPGEACRITHPTNINYIDYNESVFTLKDVKNPGSF